VGYYFSGGKKIRLLKDTVSLIAQNKMMLECILWLVNLAVHSGKNRERLGYGGAPVDIEDF
jgi:hypothetical protein